MQLPSALLSSKLGMKRSYALGLSFMGLGDVLIGFSSSTWELLLFYVIVGIGASLFFSSAGGTLALLNKSNVTPILGLYNTLFSIGGVVGVSWGVVSSVLGFSTSAIALGVVTFLCGFSTMLTDYPNAMPNISIIKNRNTIILAIGTSGVWGSYFTISELFPFFENQVFMRSPITEGLLSSILLISSSIGGLSTFIIHKWRVSTMTKIVVTAILSISPTLMLYSQVYLAGFVLIGFFNELCLSLIYGYVVSFSPLTNSSIPLAEVNSIQIGLGMMLLLSSFLPLSLIWITVVVISLAELAVLLAIGGSRSTSSL